MKKLMVFVIAMGFVIVGCDKADNSTTPAAKVAEPAAKVDSAKAAEITKADTDKDGKVAVVEYMAAYNLNEADAKKADKNANGIIEVDEFTVIAPVVPSVPPAVKK